MRLRAVLDGFPRIHHELRPPLVNFQPILCDELGEFLLFVRGTRRVHRGCALDTFLAKVGPRQRRPMACPSHGGRCAFLATSTRVCWLSSDGVGWHLGHHSANTCVTGRELRPPRAESSVRSVGSGLGLGMGSRSPKIIDP